MPVTWILAAYFYAQVHATRERTHTGSVTGVGGRVCLHNHGSLERRRKLNNYSVVYEVNGKRYEQDEALNWGFLTQPERHHRLKRGVRDDG